MYDVIYAIIEVLHQIFATINGEDFIIHNSSFIILYFMSLARLAFNEHSFPTRRSSDLPVGYIHSGKNTRDKTNQLSFPMNDVI